MKIPGWRQDANVARVTDFLRGRIGMVAAIVVEKTVVEGAVDKRLDQRGAVRHRMLADKGIVGEPDQVA